MIKKMLNKKSNPKKVSAFAGTTGTPANVTVARARGCSEDQSRVMTIIEVLCLTFILGLCSLISTSQVIAQNGQVSDDVLAAGKQVYDKNCVHCHGAEGKGDGWAAERLLPKPRDFTRGQFKIRSTESGELPTDEDLFDVITKGMPGTSMPEWDNLSGAKRRDVVDYIKTFSARFARAKGASKLIDMSDKVKYSEDSIAKGRKVYEEIECAKCHGEAGRGDGPSAPDLVDEWDHPIQAADLTRGWNFRGGGSTEEIYRRFLGGLAGTPMPSIAESFVLDEEVDEIRYMIEDGEEVTAEQRRKYEDGMSEIRTKAWHLANYVKSLSPEKPPETAIFVRSKLLEGELPVDSDDPIWDEIPLSEFPLVGQIIQEPRWFTPAIDAVGVKAVYNDKEVAILVIWNDRTNGLSVQEGELEDELVLQFPTKIPKDQQRPYFLMGDSRKKVNLWRWGSR